MVKSTIKRLAHSPEAVCILLYSLAHFLILFNKGVYWDDWWVYNANKANYTFICYQARLLYSHRS